MTPVIETRTVHEQLIRLCLDRLAAGDWRAGDRFPSERELALEHGVSRATANKVLVKLASEGWLEMRRGIGCFVGERPTLFASLRRIESFSDFTRAQGHTPSTRVVAFDPGCEAPGHVRQALGAGPKSPLTFVRRIRLMDGIPVIHEERWLPSSLYPRLKPRLMEGSFYQLCREHYGLDVQREEAQIRAVLPPSSDGIAWDSPSLRIEGTGWDVQARALWYQILHYDGARFALGNIAENEAAVPSMQLNYHQRNPETL